MSVRRRVTLALLLVFLAFGPARAEPEELRGVALVIGNGEYEHIAPLANPPSDADAVEELLSDLGFDSVRRSDRDADDLARDLERFVEDAEDADVAILYYAGHGIEAGGENWLVPVDADFSALENAAERLVPLSSVIERLQATVPVAIVLLDACRDNPFPADALVRPSPDAEPVPVSSAGLAPTRGGGSLGRAAPSSIENVGTVIGFAAEPGARALDGDPGGNSPYAAALVRHFDAMAGEEFGLVMRMVAEEVYLKTGGRQRPWVNESLRRLLYFGDAPEPVEGPEGEILEERRVLLASIADLPDPRRRQVETVARDGGVGLDGLYAVLKALGAEAPSDPGALDALLRTQAGTLRGMMTERAAWSASDEELVRLVSLAGTAVSEGALETALRLHERAKARVVALEVTLDTIEDEIRDRRLEFAAVYADSAAAHEIAFDYAQAADDYLSAFDQVERWDDALAFEYRRKAGLAAMRLGEYAGDAARLEELAASGTELERLAARVDTDAALAEARLLVGNALALLGRQRSEPETVRQAVALYEQAAALFEASGDANGVNRARNNLAHALTTLGLREAEPATLERAVAIYRSLADAVAPLAGDEDWAIARLNYAAALSQLAERSPETDVMREAADIHRGTLARLDREEHPIQWALSQSNLAGTLLFIGDREGNPSMLAESVTSGEAALSVLTRDVFPLLWASTRNQTGNAYQILGFGLADETFLRAAVFEYRDALLEWRRDRVPDDWAMATNNLANALKKLGDMTGDEALLEEAIALYRACMEVWDRESQPLNWASAQNNLGDALTIVGAARDDAATLGEAVAAFDLALSEWTRERVPYDWSVATNNRGGARVALGRITGDVATVRSGIADIETAWAFDRESGETGYDAYYRERLDKAQEALASITDR